MHTERIAIGSARPHLEAGCYFCNRAVCLKAAGEHWKLPGVCFYLSSPLLHFTMVKISAGSTLLMEERTDLTHITSSSSE